MGVKEHKWSYTGSDNLLSETSWIYAGHASW